MRKTVTSLFISLDGVVEAADDWQFAYLDEDTFGALTTAWDRVDAALMGRRSFQGYDAVRAANPASPVVCFPNRVHRYRRRTPPHHLCVSRLPPRAGLPLRSRL
jgi:hypothetical protein